MIGDFSAGARFVAAVGEAGDALGHHPRVSMGGGYVDLKLIIDDAVQRDGEGTEHVEDGNKACVCTTRPPAWTSARPGDNGRHITGTTPAHHRQSGQGSTVAQGDRRARLAREALAGHVTGPGAPVAARAAGLVRAESARSLVLVEGISDQIAVEALAHRHARDLAAEGIAVVPMGGAHAVARDLVRFGPQGAGLPIVGLCDAAEEGLFRRGLAAAGLGTPQTRSEMARLGFFVCVEDLEDELIRASGRHSIEGLLDSQGDLSSFRTLQQQPAWRRADFEAQLRRFLSAGARRKSRYAGLLVGSLDLDRMPRPLVEVLDRA